VSLTCQTCGKHLEEIADCPYCYCFPETEEIATLRAENERLDQQVEEQRQLLNTAVVKLDSCYRDYKKYRKQSEHKDARIAQLEAAVHGRQLVIDGLNDIIAESAGVAGWHLSGDVADWETFEFVALASNYATAALKGDAE